MSEEHPRYWQLWWWGTVLVGGALAYGLLHLVYFSYTFVGTLGFVAAPFVHGFVVGYVITRSKATGAFGVISAVVTSSAILTLLLIVFWGEGLFCILMAAPIWFGFSMVGTLLGRRLAMYAESKLMAFGLIPLCLVGAYHFDDVIESPNHSVQTSIEIDAQPSDVWPLLFELNDLGEPDAWYFRAGVACPIGTSSELETNTRLCHMTTGDLIERIEVLDENREVRWTVQHTPDSVKEWNPFNAIKPPHVEHSFRVLKGGFRLQAMPGGRTKMVGWTTYRSDLAPDIYWNLWNRMIVRGVQTRVMNAIAKQVRQAAAINECARLEVPLGNRFS